jgi:hypothetical protein
MDVEYGGIYVIDFVIRDRAQEAAGVESVVVPPRGRGCWVRGRRGRGGRTRLEKNLGNLLNTTRQYTRGGGERRGREGHTVAEWEVGHDEHPV